MRDELAGWIGGFTRYGVKAGASEVPNWLQLFSAGTIDYRRKTGEPKTVRVRGVAVSVCGTTQPDVIARAMTPELRAAGLFARLLVAYPPLRQRVWSEAEVPVDNRRAVADLLGRLHTLEFRTDDSGTRKPRVVGLSDAAKTRFVEFYNRNGEQLVDCGTNDERAARAKIEGYAARFALIFHCCRHSDAPDDHDVRERDMTDAVTLAEWFAAESARVYRLLGESAERQELRTRAEQVARKSEKHGGTITVRELQKSNSRKYKTSKLAEAELEALVDGGYGIWEPTDGPSGGKPSRAYRPSPLAAVEEPAPIRSDPTDDGDGDPPQSDTGSDDDSPPPPQPPGPTGGCTTGTEQVSDVSDCRTGSTPHTTEPSPTSGDDDYILIDRTEQLPAVADAIRAAGRVGVDTETTALNPRDGKLRLVQIATPSVTFVVDCFAVDPAPLFPALADVEVVGHNLQFDSLFMMPLGFVPGRLFDTMLASQVLDAGDRDARHNLAAVCERYLGARISKDEQQSDWSGPLTAEQLRYAATDARLPLRLYPVLVAKLTAARLTATADLENRALPAIAALAHRGVAIDRDAWARLAATAAEEARQLTGEMNALLPAPVANWNSNPQVKRAFSSIGVTLTSTADETLATVTHPLADLLPGTGPRPSTPDLNERRGPVT